MSRTVRKFAVSKAVSNEYARLAKLDVRSYAIADVQHLLEGDVFGPRGGRYRLFGELTVREHAHVALDSVTYVGTRMGRYQRP